MRLFLDANVLLDVLLSRQPFVNDSERVLSALHSPHPDFEDAVQAICAGDCHADAIVTRDKKGFADSGITVYTPTELLEKHVAT